MRMSILVICAMIVYLRVKEAANWDSVPSGKAALQAKTEFRSSWHRVSLQCLGHRYTGLLNCDRTLPCPHETRIKVCRSFEG